ncbi:MAG: hypothetical protein CM15mP45_04540 [Deltaproteobacteria bacterium]|nr:MAG: hypothetical protein CM15mP45_04540 [Deltaproteobacteria bacterium]
MNLDEAGFSFLDIGKASTQQIGKPVAQFIGFQWNFIF